MRSKWTRRPTLRRVFLLLVATLLMWTTPGDGVQADTPPPVTVYYNRACGDCLQYIEETVVPLLRQAGYTDFAYEDYVNEPENRAELVERSDALGVPPDLQSHLTVFVGERLILEGHIPEHVIADLLTPWNGPRPGVDPEEETYSTGLTAPDEAFERMVVYQDEMSGATEYTAWAFRGQPKTYPLDTPIGEYLDYLEEQGLVAQEDLAPAASIVREERNLLPMVLASGFLDGLNPCAFAVLLFFVAFLFTIQRTSGTIWVMGLIYIAAIYLAYFLIGLGLMRAVIFAGKHHLMARIGAGLVIALGLINVKDYVFPELPIHLRIPTIAHGTIQEWLKKATFPAAGVGGFLVGLCTFPCSGGIYVAIVGLLAARSTYLQGVGYLGLYNLAFVAPLLITLVGVGNRRVLHHVRLAEQSSRRWVRLATGLAMVAVGVVILVWFV